MVTRATHQETRSTAGQGSEGGSDRQVTETAIPARHFAAECDHGDTPTQATNAGYSRKPNGGGFYAY